METLVEQNPEIIFITSMGKPEEIENRLRTDFKNNPAWNSLPAVKAGRVYVLPEKLFLINPGLRYPEAVSLWHSRFIRRSLLMENKQSAEQTEHFGIGRTKWRITILVIFLFLALLGSFLSLTKGSSIISIKEITDILLNPGDDPRSQIIWNIPYAAHHRRLPWSASTCRFPVRFCRRLCVIRWQTRILSASAPAQDWQVL